ncbi:MAG TPA: hypothetical protein PK006_08660 [Saprospiraceae bacterium]|nr:hypothetical protein [Saprospiraceae bacterium]
MKEIFIFIVGLILGAFLYALFTDNKTTFPDDCKKATLSNLHFDSTKVVASDIAYPQVIATMNLIKSNDSIANRYFTISKDMVSYMYLMYEVHNVAGFRFAPVIIPSNHGTQDTLYYCLPVDNNNSIFRLSASNASPIPIYSSSEMLIRPCPHNCD